ncbi:MAG: FAD-binding protein, partial [Adlercreutzia sp.]|nr:FAD-binding protein [Adlercreutzia sp.]
MIDATAFTAQLHALVGESAVRPNEPLAAHTTFRIGGPAQWLVLPRTEDEVAAVVSACREAEVPLRILGAGSNVLAPDEGLPGVTLKLADNFAAVEV